LSATIQKSLDGLSALVPHSMTDGDPNLASGGSSDAAATARPA